MKFIHKSLKSWLYVDTRTLALFRIVFGLLGFCDVLRRYGVIEVFYSNQGMNFRRQVTSQYATKYFSLLDYFHSTIEVQLFFIATALCFFFLIIGYRTRLFQLLSAVGLISIHNAAVILENGADMVFNNYLVWILFLPLGTSWSVDAIRRSIKNNPEHDSNDLNHPINPVSTNIFHFAYLACLIQLSMIYFYNHINKTGAMWLDGTAIYYMYQLDTFLTPAGEWLASILSINIIKFLTSLTMYIEFFAPIAILSPIFQPWLRRITFIIFIFFHLIIGISVNIGLFSGVMMAVLILLLGSQDIDLLKNIISKYFRRKYFVFYDRDCGFCHLTARILKRMDGFSNLTWADRLTEGGKPKNLDNLLETTIVVWDQNSDKIWTRHKAFSRIIGALPFGFLFSWIFKIPGLEKIFGYIYDKISQNRTSISQTMGLPACGLKQDGEEVSSSLNIKKDNIFVHKGRKVIMILSNILVLSLLIGAMDYSTRINDGFQNIFSKEEKKLKKQKKSSNFQSPRQRMKRILLYPRMYQEWNMFSPSVITREKWIIADLTFENGEKLSLFQGDENIVNTFDRRYFRPYNNQFWRKLFTRLGKSSYQKHIPKFKKWLINTNYFPEYDKRTVKNIKLWKLSERTPDPYSSNPNIKKVTKRELKKTNKSGRKSRKSPIKKNQGKRPEIKQKLK